MSSVGWVLLITALSVAAAGTQKITEPKLRRAAAVFVTVTLSLTCVEGLSRLLFTDPSTYDWRRLTVPLAWERWEFTLNGQEVGAPRSYFSLDGRTVARSQDVPRILFVGDSFTAGQGVRPGQAFPQLVDAGLKGAEVLIHAMPGLDLRTEVELYTAYSALWQPDVVVWGYVLNDLPAADGTPQDCLRPAAPGMMDFIVDRSQIGFVGSSSRAIAVAQLVLQKRRVGNCMMSSYSQRYDEKHNPEGTGSLRADFSIVAEELKSRGGRLIVVLLPLMHNLADYPFRAAHDSIARSARSAGAETIDLSVEFAGMDETTLWASQDDHHPNPIAHALIARRVLGVLGADALPITCGSSEANGCNAAETSPETWLATARNQSRMYDAHARATRPHRVVAKIAALQAAAIANDGARTQALSLLEDLLHREPEYRGP